jgi:DNA-nicking Smr family endonuclease
MMSVDDLSEEDKKLFREMMKSVKPLSKVTPKTIQKIPRPNRIAKKEMAQERSFDSPYLSDFYTNAVQAESILSYDPNRLSTQFRLLKAGNIPWKARLDLHGLMPNLARDALCTFLSQHHTLGHRCVLIIHGKGGRKGEEPVLKNLVNHWLPQIPTVLAFHSAIPRDGGAGALYVLLKRNRLLSDDE